MAELDLESLDVSDAETASEPEPTPEPTPEPAQPAEQPIVESAERVRDPATGQFVAQPPTGMPDPAKPADPAPAAQTPAAQKPEEPRVIPLAAHLEERRRFQQEISERDRRLEEVNARIAKLETPPAPEPEFVEDPKAYVDAQAAKNAKELESLKQQAAQLQNEQQFSRFVSEISAREAEFVATTPDYYDALGHIRAARAEQLRDFYPEATDDQIKQAISQEELTAAANLMQMGRNPAEAVYRMAKTYGFKPKAVAQQPAAKPDIPRAPVADPASTLGSSGGPPADEAGIDDMAEDDMDPFKQALRERFGARG